ncbi:Photosynthetic NDH subunit of lumenal location 2, chloroplastic [Linum grandiflorum]
MNCNSFTNLPKIIHPKPSNNNNNNSSAKPSPSQPTNAITTTDSTRRKLVTTFLATTSLAAAAQLHQPASASAAPAQTWGVRSHIFERFFQPDLSPEESVERIRQTAEGLHSIRDMMDAMAWRFILFYIRLKQDYLDKDLKIAMAVVPQGKRKDYVVKANELVENMSQLDKFIRSPKVYESYLYYEKTLDSIDDLVQFLA